jgi:arylformamidase
MIERQICLQEEAPSMPDSHLPHPDYEVEYNNRARVPEHPAIIAQWGEDAAAFRASANCELGVSYGDSERQVYDLFRPQMQAGDALVMFIHGGYWQGLHPSRFSHMARGLTQSGVPVAVVGYDLCPQVTVGQIIWQMRAAAAALWRRFHVPIVAVGHSAGGHLAACLLATDWPMFGPDLPKDMVRAAYGFSGVYNLKPLTETSLNGALQLTFEEAEARSPFFWPAPAGLTLDAVVGAQESSEFLKQSRRIVDVWGLAGVRTRYEEIAGANHFTVIAPLTERSSTVTRRIAELAGVKDA